MSDSEELHDVAARFQHGTTQQNFDEEIGVVSADVVAVGDSDRYGSADYDNGVGQPAPSRFVRCRLAAERHQADNDNPAQQGVYRLKQVITCHHRSLS